MRKSFLLLTLTLLISLGCHKKPAAVVLPPAAPATNTEAAPVPEAVTPGIVHAPADFEPSPIAKTITPPSNLELGEIYFRTGHYPEAIRELEAFLKSNPKSAGCDRALFQLGLSRALAKDSAHNMRLFETNLRKLISEYPRSPYRDQAEFVLLLQSQIEKLKSDVKDRDEKIKKLSEELQALKDIDLQRRPSRPKE
jgi:hypothetical protein